MNKSAKALSIERPSRKFTQLSPRQAQVLDLLVLGRTNAEIASEAGISIRTTELHRKRLMTALGVGNAAELLWMALVGQLPPKDYR